MEGSSTPKTGDRSPTFFPATPRAGLRPPLFTSRPLLPQKGDGCSWVTGVGWDPLLSSAPWRLVELLTFQIREVESSAEHFFFFLRETFVVNYSPEMGLSLFLSLSISHSLPFLPFSLLEEA